MLIRTQDRKALVDMSGTTIRVFKPYNDKPKLTLYGNNQPADAAETLGIYGSEERAIEVLDEIQNFHGKLLTLDDSYNDVFEMPEE